MQFLIAVLLEALDDFKNFKTSISSTRYLNFWLISNGSDFSKSETVVGHIFQSARDYYIKSHLILHKPNYLDQLTNNILHCVKIWEHFRFIHPYFPFCKYFLTHWTAQLQKFAAFKQTQYLSLLFLEQELKNDNTCPFFCIPHFFGYTIKRGVPARAVDVRFLCLTLHPCASALFSVHNQNCSWWNICSRIVL